MAADAGNRDLTKDYHIQINRIERILDDTIEKIRLMSFAPCLLENNAEALHSNLPSSDVHFITAVCMEENVRSMTSMPRLSNISSQLNTLRQSSGKLIAASNTFAEDSYETHVSYVVDTVCRTEGLLDILKQIKSERSIDPTAETFVNLLVEFKTIVLERMRVSAIDEINYENDLKNAYRSNNILSDNVKESEEQLEKQRDELGREYDKKYEVMCQLEEKIEELKEWSKDDVEKIIHDSEVQMMKDYIKSTERQEILAVDAKQSVQQYDNLLSDHLSEEKSLRTKRFKVEMQLSSWLAKYDQDIGEKQAEYEGIENEYNAEKEKYNKIQEAIEEQQDLYRTLMKEKEIEQRRIYEEKAIIFLRNRSARIIQRAYREYRIRKAARKKGRKGKKDKKEKGKKEKKKDEVTTRTGPDPNALIDTKFGADILGDLKDGGEDPFSKKPVTVDLND